MAAFRIMKARSMSPTEAENDMPQSESHGSSPRISPSVLDELLKDYTSPSDLTGPNGLIKELMGALISRAMEAELTHHLGYEANDAPPAGQPNRRNGRTQKTLRSNTGPVQVNVPRDREGSFEPQIVGKHQRHFDGFDDKIIAMYGRGMSVRDIRATLAEIYHVEVSADLISRATDAVVDELRVWQQRPLESLYCVVYIDAMMVKIRDKAGVRNKAVYSAIGIAQDGQKQILGMWIEATEGAKFWLSILQELKRRGVDDVLIVCADGLKGLPDAVEAIFPRAIFQTCIVHVIRSSTRFVPWKERKAVCADLRAIYTAADIEIAEHALTSFEAKWGQRFPMIGDAWRRRWAEITPFLAFPDEIRRAIYTTNIIEALHRQLRKVIKTRGHMPNDQAAMKLLFLAARNAEKSWKKPPLYWSKALLQFAIHFEDRIR
jgi:putative transposase